MLFTRLGMIAAWIVMIYGVGFLGLGLYVAFGPRTADFDASKYLGTLTSGQAMDQGAVLILCAIALGVLAEISRSVRSRP